MSCLQDLKIRNINLSLSSMPISHNLATFHCCIAFAEWFCKHSKCSQNHITMLASLYLITLLKYLTSAMTSYIYNYVLIWNYKVHN